jgi:hypothetical protein
MTDNVRELHPVRVPWDVAVHAATTGARFVTPEEFLDGIPDTVRLDMVKDTVTKALADAADAEGVLLNFHHPKFYTTHVANVLNQDLADDEHATPLVYDRFIAITLLQCISALMLDDGLLANRGNGDSADYRLILP